MHTKITFLSHASFLIEYGEKKLLFDPWLFGTCYWKSWWNYPEVKKELILDLKPDAIYITHFHWDHWHGPSLKKLFSRDTEIITHREANNRSVDDLKSIGFKNITLLNHCQSYKIGDIHIVPYQFGLFLNDSAVIVKAGSITLLNANDCKIAGLSLRQIITEHPNIDFALRSHSSANDRVCYTVEGENDFFMDDKNHYSRSFKYFMDVVKPKYAVPFASNHCHLHKDVFHLNDYVNDPIKLKLNLEELGGLKFSELKIMLSGDSWSSRSGFQTDLDQLKIFDDKDAYLEAYRERNKLALDDFYEREDKVVISQIKIDKFKNQIKSIPFLFRRRFKDWSYGMQLRSENTFNEKFYKVIPSRAVVEEINQETFNNYKSKIIIPIKIFSDSVMLNMFHHGSISKRNKYIFANKAEFLKYTRFQDYLEYVEMQVFPLSLKYTMNLIKNYTYRWREIIVYLKALYFKIRYGKAIFLVEEKILEQT